MWNFVFLSDGSQKPAWYLRIDDVHQLMEWWTKYGLNQTVNSYFSNPHKEVMAFESAVQIMNREYINDDNIFKVSDMFVNKKILRMIDIIQQGEVIYININGGYMTLGDFKEVKSEIKDDIVFPVEKEQEIRVLKWEGGLHYYAKVGEQDVIVDGMQKWKTEWAAKDAAKRFCKNNGIKIKED